MYFWSFEAPNEKATQLRCKKCVNVVCTSSQAGRRLCQRDYIGGLLAVSTQDRSSHSIHYQLCTLLPHNLRANPLRSQNVNTLRCEAGPGGRVNLLWSVSKTVQEQTPCRTRNCSNIFVVTGSGEI